MSVTSISCVVGQAMRCILGIDSGGTKCDALVARDDGVALGWGRCDIADPGSGRSGGGSGRSVGSIGRAVEQAMDGVECDELHITGVTGWVPLSFLHGRHGVKIETHPISECAAPLALVGETAGVVVLAGTGAFVHGKTRDGRELLLDALGPVLGDFGGGYHIGLLALQAAAKSRWHPRHETSLAPHILRACGVKDADRRGTCLISYMQERRDRAEIASFARLVNTEAEAGDHVAIGILQEAAAAMAETLFDVVDSLGMTEEEYVMAGTGSVATQSRVYWQHLCELAKRSAPLLRPVISDLPPVVGMVLLALRRMVPSDPQALEHGLFRSVRELLPRKKR